MKLLPQEKKSIEQTPTDNIEAYTYYLRGRDFCIVFQIILQLSARRCLPKRWSSIPLMRAPTPEWPTAIRSFTCNVPIDFRFDGILAMSAKALALDNGLAEAHASRGVGLVGGAAYARKQRPNSRRPSALDPNSFEAHYFYARACVFQGKIEQADGAFERAAEIKPDDYASVLHVDPHLSIARPEAGCQRGRAQRCQVGRAPAYPLSGRCQASHTGVGALIELGEFDRAREWIARALAIEPDDPVTHYNVPVAIQPY